MKVRLEIEIDVDVDENGCWIPNPDQSFILEGNGYNKIVASTHRLSYENRNGRIPDGLQIDHLCRVRGCMCPDHLEAVTPKENVFRSTSPCAKNARKTHCPQGHKYSKKNTILKQTKKGPARICRKCQAAADARRNEKRPKAGYVSGDAHWTRQSPEAVARGSRHHAAKLTEKKVRKIRKRFAEGGITQKELAKQFGISHASVNALITRRTWSHVS